ncbi:uncharacterized protein LOC129983909 [Argiope bruennichi]|uniref:uncharacterized protein LOC129983909 n=1 Tax=Argiope bruennichi TaxID=94029 RepID=UPI002494BC5E|nr:uncharacterized protein LOC129983909 [Argiope bruennichi]
MRGCKNNLRISLSAAVIIACLQSALASGCSSGFITFELITGYVYTSPGDTMELAPGTLKLTDCLSLCNANATCQAINFETGLCVLFSSSANQRPNALTPSQFPVFTIYAHKVCLLGRKRCDRDWMFERVNGYELRDVARSSAIVMSREACMELCLNEIQFQCRSANYNRMTGECFLSDKDRTSLSLTSTNRYFGQSSESVDYLESNCVDDPVRLCEFRKLNGKILKTVDAVYQDVTTLDECRQKCLSVNYRCQSFDYGDPSQHVCRLSHHSVSTLTHIQDPYLDIPGVTTYEISACYNVTIQCKAREMIAKVKTSKVFNGRIYAKSRPNSCVADVANSVDFEIKMAYHDLNCDVKQENFGEFSNDIVIQHHDMIVTNQDLGLSVHCQYDLSNRSVSHGVQLEINGEVDAAGTQSATVSSPNVTMMITDRLGNDITAAQVGDALALRFEIIDPNSPYEIFVRELVAMDGIDNSEILLIDSLGCPTDVSIMGSLSKAGNSGKTLLAPFEAFKFPTSDIVQFKALVTPCLPNCEPVDCSVKAHGQTRDFSSMGRRKRRGTAPYGMGNVGRVAEKDDVVVVQTIQITDKFGFEKQDKMAHKRGRDDISEELKKESTCVNLVGLIVASSMFLVAQLLLILAWAILWQRRRRSKLDDDSTTHSTRSFASQYFMNRRH